MSENKPEKKTYANRLASTRTCGQLINKHWESVFAAPEEGVPVCWYDGYTITPFLQVMGIRYAHGEAFSALLAGRHNELLPQKVSEDRGYDRELCSYARTHMGAAYMTAHGFPPEAEGSIATRLPKPDLMISAYPECTTGQLWDDFAHRLFDKQPPKFNVHIPFLWGGDVEDCYMNGPQFIAARDYLKDQLYEMVKFLEDYMHKPFDWDELSNVMAALKTTAKYRIDAMDLCTVKPAPATFFDWTVAIGPVSFVNAGPEQNECFKAIYDEIKERHDNGIGEVPNERYRLYWDGIMNWNKVGWLSEKFASYDCAMVAGRYTNAGFWPMPELIDPADPMDGIAANILCCPSNHAIPPIKQLTKDLTEKYSIDGVIFHTSRTCRALTNPQMVLTEYTARKLGLSTTSFEGDVTDASFYQDEILNTHLEALLESIDARRAQQAR